MTHGVGDYGVCWLIVALAIGCRVWIHFDKTPFEDTEPGDVDASRARQ